MARGRVKVEVDLRDLKRLLSKPEEVLRALDVPIQAEARRTLDVASFLVPRGDPTDDSNLAGTGFLSGPIYNPDVWSTTFLAGFSHPAAGAIHEGFHWGEETVHPRPRWMRHAIKGARGRSRKAVAATLMQSLRRFFPAK